MTGDRYVRLLCSLVSRCTPQTARYQLENTSARTCFIYCGCALEGPGRWQGETWEDDGPRGAWEEGGDQREKWRSSPSMGSVGFFPGIAVLAFLEASGFIEWLNVGQHAPVDAGTTVAGVGAASNYKVGRRVSSRCAHLTSAPARSDMNGRTGELRPARGVEWKLPYNS